MLPPFLVQGQEAGGLGMTTAAVGIVYGTFGVIALALGGILGGFYAARFGLKRSLIPMVLAITLPDAIYLVLSMFPTSSQLWITVVVFIEQFGYGFGFTAYMLYLMHFAKGEYQTSHYALSTGFMALGMMLPGMVAGYIQEAVGYTGLFWLVMACCLLSIAVTLFVRRALKE
jgi:PAT family beta-lactamase induction signal transducer AmpG